MGAAAGAAAAAAAVRKRKIVSSSAFGVIVTTSPEDFLRAVALEAEPLIISSVRRTFWNETVKGFRYLACVRGLAFFCESRTELALPGNALLIEAENLKVPADL